MSDDPDPDDVPFAGRSFDGIREFVEADGIPDHWPRRLRRACRARRWALATWLEQDHIERAVARAFRQAGL